MSLPLRHPFTALLAGPTGCSKTRFVFKLIADARVMVDPPPRRIVYCYGQYQQLFCKYPRVTFHQGLPNLNDFDGGESTLLVVDDLMNETDDSVANLFTKGSHHRNISVVFLVQNLFHKNKHIRTISLNAHYMVLFKNPQDASQLASLARQMYPNRSAFAVEAYRRDTRTVQLFVRRPPTGAGRGFTTAHEHISRRDGIRLRTEMSTRVKKFLPTLKRIRRIGDRARRDYVRKCDNEFIHCVSECAKNLIKGNVPLTTHEKTCVADVTTSELCLPKKLRCERKERFCRKMAF